MAACFNQLPDSYWHRYRHVYSILNRVIALVPIYLIFKLCTCTFILACRPPTLCCLMWNSNTWSSHSDCCTNRQQLTDKNLQGDTRYHRRNWIYFKQKFEVPNHLSIENENPIDIRLEVGLEKAHSNTKGMEEYAFYILFFLRDLHVFVGLIARQSMWSDLVKSYINIYISEENMTLQLSKLVASYVKTTAFNPIQKLYILSYKRM